MSRLTASTIRDLESRIASGNLQGYTLAQTEAALAFWRGLAARGK